MKIIKNLSTNLFVIAFHLISVGLSGQISLEEPWEVSINERQPPVKVMQAIGVKPGMIIGEVGAGRGRYTVFLAKEAGLSGKVYANDIDELSLAYLRGRSRRLGITNIETITGIMDDPLFPEKSLDMAIMVLVYHMLENPDILLENIKKSLKPGGTLVILDPADKEIDREFGIDRSKPDVKVPTIRERIDKSAKAAGYEVIRVETFLPSDLIFILKPILPAARKSAEEILRSKFLNNGIEASTEEFKRIKSDTANYVLSEMVFRILGYEFIGSKSYPEAIAVLGMGIELYPQSSKLYGEIGEAYLMQGDKEKARSSYQRASEIDPDNFEAKYLLKDFDALFDEIHPKKK